MKRYLAVISVLALLTACASTDPYQKRAEAERERQNKLAERALDQAPKWMIDLPKSDSAIYQNGTSVSPDMAMAVNKAKTVAYGKICMSAGGRVAQQSKVYRVDSDESSAERSEMAIRSLCPNVDISGVEVADTKLISEGGRFRAYVLVALPLGDANRIQKENERKKQAALAEVRSREAFKELDQKTAETKPE